MNDVLRSLRDERWRNLERFRAAAVKAPVEYDLKTYVFSALDKIVINSLLAGKHLVGLSVEMNYSTGWARNRVYRMRDELRVRSTEELLVKLAMCGRIVEGEDGTCQMM